MQEDEAGPPPYTCHGINSEWTPYLNTGPDAINPREENTGRNPPTLDRAIICVWREHKQQRRQPTSGTVQTKGLLHGGGDNLK